jgi:hypothetical protein
VLLTYTLINRDIDESGTDISRGRRGRKEAAGRGGRDTGHDGITQKIKD